MKNYINVYTGEALNVVEKLEMGRPILTFNTWYMNPNGVIWYKNSRGYLHNVKISKGYTPHTYDIADYKLSRNNELQFTKNLYAGLTKDDLTAVLLNNLSKDDDITLKAIAKIVNI